MGSLLLMPGPEDRELIKDLVKLRAAGSIGEAGFSLGVAGLLRCYGVKKLSCDTFYVKDCGDFRTRIGDFPVVAIKPLVDSVDGTCPVCGTPAEDRGGWLRGEGEVTMGCLGCGAVYSWRAPADAEL